MQRKIPTLVGIILTLVLVAGLALTTRLVERATKIFSRAEESSTPTSPVGTGNISNSEFSVYWTTEKEIAGTVFWGKTAKLGDGSALSEKSTTHLVRVTGLQPSTKYYFKVSSDDPPYEVSTGPKLATLPVQEPVYGKVLDSSGVPRAAVIAIWETAGSTKVVALSKTDGTYVLPIALARTSDLTASFTPSLAGEETITLVGSGVEKSVITCKSGLDRPLPTTKLGQDTDCSKRGTSAPAIVATPAASLSTNISEGQAVSTPLPTISGKAGSNQVVKIEIHSPEVFSGTVIADPAGNWSWTPPSNLSVGQHTVTITVVNADGTTQAITRTFYVSSGESILPVTSGTPSAVITHKECVSNSCTVVSGAGPDSCRANIDCAPAPVATPPATPPPVTGRTENTLALLTIGAVLGTLGLWILARG